MLLVSGVFILLAASLDFGALRALDWRAALFVVVVMLVVRPATVFGALFGAGLPWREEVLIAFTGPRGVVLVAVAGLFGERLAALGIADAAVIGPLAFALVAATVVLHGFTLTPFAQFLGLSGVGPAGGDPRRRLALHARTGRGADQGRDPGPADRPQLRPSQCRAGGGAQDLFGRHPVGGGR